MTEPTAAPPEPGPESPPRSPDAPGQATGAAAPGGAPGDRRGRRRSGVRRLFGWSLAAFGAMLAVVLLLVLFVLGTQTGLRTALAVLEDFAPGLIEVGRVEGRLLGRLELDDLELHLAGLDADIGTFVLDWNPGALFAGRLQVDDLIARNASIVGPAPPQEEPPPEPFELPSFKLPLGIELGRLLIEDLSYKQVGAPAASAIQLSRAELSATAAGETLDLDRLVADLSQPRAHLQAAGRVALTGRYPVSLSFEWQFRQQPALQLQGEGAFSGDLTRLSVSHRVSGSVEAELEAELRDVVEDLNWDAEVSLDAIDLPSVVADAPPLDLRASLTSEGDLDHATLTGTLRGQSPAVAEMGRLTADLDVVWAEQVLTVKALRLSELAADAAAKKAPPSGVSPANARLDLTGRLDIAPPAPVFEADAVWEHLRWPLAGEPAVELPQGSLNAYGDLDDYTYRLSTTLFGQSIPEAAIALKGTGNREQTSISELNLKTLSGEVGAKGLVAWSPEPAWDLAITASGIDPGVQWDGLGGSVDLKADTRGDLADGYRYGLKLDAALEAYPPALLNLSGTGTAQAVELSELSVETLGGLIEGDGRFGWVPAATWSFDLDARDLDPGRYESSLAGVVGFSVGTSGGLEDGYQVTLNGDADLKDYPPVRIDLVARGTDASAKVETLGVELVDGRIDGSGSLRWSPALGWDVELVAQGLNPGEVFADWPGTIGGRVATEGSSGGDGLALRASISDFGGELRGYPVQAGAELAVQGEMLELESLEASSGETRLSASGRADETLEFRYDFRSPSLAALVPDLQGRLSAKGTIEGTRAAPRAAIYLNGRDIAMDRQGIERLAATVEAGLDPESPLALEITARNLLAGGQRFETLRIQGQGSMRSHRLTADVSSEPLRLAAAVDGGLNDAGGYGGALRRLELESEDFGGWALQRAAPFKVGDGAVEVGPLCVANGSSSRGCVAFQQPEAGRFSASLDLERLDFDLLDALTPDVISPEGYLTANARFEGIGERLTGTARMSVPEGMVEIVLPQASQTLTFSGTGLDLDANGSGINASFRLPVEDVGRIDAKIGVPGFRLTAGGQQPLRGQLQIDLEGIDRFSALAPDLHDIQGGVEGDLALDGTLDQPSIRGDLSVRDLALTVPSIGLEIVDLNLTARSETANKMQLSGGASIGGGQLDLDGAATGLGGAEPQLTIELTGDRLKVADTKEYRAILSLDLKAGLGPGGGAVQGEVRLPEARIMPRSIPAGTVQPSSDVVLEEKTKQDPLPFSVDVLAKLGDDVLIEAFGLRGELRGQLRVTQQPGGALLGDGELQVVDGTYRVSLPGLGILTSVGKPLVIEKGIVVYAKTPLDNPGIILNAQRQGGDITAGVRVLGTLRNPKLAFFSESDPNMTQSEITSYLVTGIPPKRDAAADDRSISLGTYIAPNLFMEYDTSLGDQSDSVKMRYDLTESIQVQSETGDSQGVDIFYKFEN